MSFRSFIKRSNFHEFLFTFLKDEAFGNGVHYSGKGCASKGANSFPQELTPIRNNFRLLSYE